MSNWFAPSLAIDEQTRTEIETWVHEQKWPEGTKLKDPSTYHITVLYSPDAFGTPEAENLLRSANDSDWAFGMRVAGVEAFNPGDTDGASTPVVLELHGILLKLYAESILDEAEAMGIKVSRFEGGYRPHITVATLPPGATLPEFHTLPGADDAIGFPLKFVTSAKLVDLHADYNERKAAKS